MPTEIIVSILTGLGTLAGVLISNSRSPINLNSMEV